MPTYEVMLYIQVSVGIQVEADTEQIAGDIAEVEYSALNGKLLWEKEHEVQVQHVSEADKPA
jgi:hypothetical protein